MSWLIWFSLMISALGEYGDRSSKIASVAIAAFGWAARLGRGGAEFADRSYGKEGRNRRHGDDSAVPARLAEAKGRMLLRSMEACRLPELISIKLVLNPGKTDHSCGIHWSNNPDAWGS
ncbi:hypothetical protein JNB91_02410 [Rhizobium wenxiniae]|uniref:hypothetical protein n=1 Tax=Rhizobium wenxiniae TaxID=1737357 RepID=UPI001C6E96E1|nr:hypothetical protein [Rhizobium wenxiniae]MBW9086685.1 hypothetical protein [Rhizobium wenxiniae]